MKKRICAIIGVVIVLCAFLCVSTFAVNDGSYVYTVGAANGIPRGSNSYYGATWGSEYGIYGGVLTYGSNAQYVRKMWSYNPDKSLTYLDFGIMLDLVADTTVELIIPYHYNNVTGDYYKVSYLYDYNGSSAYKNNPPVEGVLNVEIVDTTVSSAGPVTYDCFPLDSSSYSYTYSGSTFNAVKVYVTGSATGVVIVYFRLRFIPQLVGDYTDLITPIEDIFEDTDALSIVETYFVPIVSTSWVSLFIAISMLALLVGLFMNWVLTL